MPAEPIDDVSVRIAQDFSNTSGDNYEIINPYEGNLISNTNSFLGQYCAAKNLDWRSISPSDLEAMLRAGKSHLYTYTSTTETRWVDADDPDTPDVVEQDSELWYIYTIVYNGERYFADTIFQLSDDQKALADDYAWNLVALMTKGHFTSSGHFIVLRGVQNEKILVADPSSYTRSQKTWDLSIILSEASRSAAAGGPFWIIG